MVCPKCNSQYADNLPACPFCSAAEQAPQQAPFQVPQGAAEFAPPPAPVKKKSKAGIIIPIVVAVIFVVLGIASTIMNNKEATYVFYQETSEDGFDMSMEYTLYCKGDKVEDMQWNIVYEYDDLYADYMTEIEDSIVESFEDEYGDYDFIEISSETNGTAIEVTIMFNDIEENIDTYIELDVVEDGADFLSYEKSKENLIDDGFELKE